MVVVVVDSFGGWFSNMTTGGEGPVQLKMLCGADILESFLKPKLYKDSDVSSVILLALLPFSWTQLFLITETAVLG